MSERVVQATQEQGKGHGATTITTTAMELLRYPVLEGLALPAVASLRRAIHPTQVSTDLVAAVLRQRHQQQRRQQEQEQAGYRCTTRL